jgi:hypothetical protein
MLPLLFITPCGLLSPHPNTFFAIDNRFCSSAKRLDDVNSLAMIEGVRYDEVISYICNGGLQ